MVARKSCNYNEWALEAKACMDSENGNELWKALIVGLENDTSGLGLGLEVMRMGNFYSCSPAVSVGEAMEIEMIRNLGS